MKVTINKQILRLAIPNILTNLSVPLLSSVDTAVVGHLDKVYYLGAIAVGSMIFNFIYWGLGFLRMGTTGLTSQAFGQSNDKEISLNLFRPLTVAIISGLLLVLFQYFIAEFAFYIIMQRRKWKISRRNIFTLEFMLPRQHLQFMFFMVGFLVCRMPGFQ